MKKKAKHPTAGGKPTYLLTVIGPGKQVWPVRRPVLGLVGAFKIAERLLIEHPEADLVAIRGQHTHTHAWNVWRASVPVLPEPAAHPQTGPDDWPD